MKGRKFFLLALLVTILSLSMVQMMSQKKVPAAVTAPSKKIAPPPPVNPYLQSLIGDFEQEFISLLELSQTPGASLAIVKDSTILFIKGYGVKRTGSQDSVDINTVFRLG